MDPRPKPAQLEVLDQLNVGDRPKGNAFDWGALPVDRFPTVQQPALEGELFRPGEDRKPLIILDELEVTATPKPAPRAGGMPSVLRPLTEVELKIQLDTNDARQAERTRIWDQAEKDQAEIRRNMWAPAPPLPAAPAELEVLQPVAVEATKPRTLGGWSGFTRYMQNVGTSVVYDRAVGLIADDIIGNALARDAARTNLKPVRVPRAEQLDVLSELAVTAAPRVDVLPEVIVSAEPQLDVLEALIVEADRRDRTRGGTAAARGSATRLGSQPAVRGRVGMPGLGSGLDVATATRIQPAPAPASRAAPGVSSPPAVSFAPDLGQLPGRFAQGQPQVGSGFGPPNTAVQVKSGLDKCKCPKKKKSKKREPRTVCYKGTYTERAKGLSKVRREQVPCQ